MSLPSRVVTLEEVTPQYGNVNDNPISAGKIREACTASLRELGDRLKGKIDRLLISGEHTKDLRYSFLDSDNKIKLMFDLTELANEDRTKEEREQLEGYYTVPDLVKEYLEVYYNGLGWGTNFFREGNNRFYLTVGPIKKDLV